MCWRAAWKSCVPGLGWIGTSSIFGMFNAPHARPLVLNEYQNAISASVYVFARPKQARIFAHRASVFQHMQVDVGLHNHATRHFMTSALDTGQQITRPKADVAKKGEWEPSHATAPLVYPSQPQPAAPLYQPESFCNTPTNCLSLSVAHPAVPEDEAVVKRDHHPLITQGEPRT